MTGSMFHEIVAIPSLMPEAAHPYKLPGVQPGMSALDDIPWACPYLQSMHEVLCTEQDGKSVTSPSPLATGLPPLPANNTSPVIVMTFWYVFRNGLNFFELFKLYFHLGLITTPMFSMFT